jgi:hypothetical protein
VQTGARLYAYETPSTSKILPRIFVDITDYIELKVQAVRYTIRRVVKDMADRAVKGLCGTGH